MRRIRIAEILDFLAAQGIAYSFTGNRDALIRRMANINGVQDESICWVKNKDYLTEEVRRSLRLHNHVLVVAPFEIDSVNVIVVEQPKHVFFPIINHFFYRPKPHMISERAVVLTDQIGKNVHIGPGCYIGEDVAIGDNTILHPNVVIECPCKIGAGCEIFAGVVIGTDGFGYYKEGSTPRREIHYKGVILGENVEVGANSCIDRGLLTDTIIGNNVKIDNLCHIAHNVTIEDNCLIIAGTAICGSAHIGRNAYLAPGCIVRNQIRIGADAFAGLGAVIVKDVNPGETVAGSPAKPFKKR